MRRIYITGCAGSGTTLVQRLFTAFAGLEVIWGETRVGRFVGMEAPEGRRLVGKRWKTTVFSDVLRRDVIRDQLVMLRSTAIVNVVRREKSAHVSEERYLSCMIQADRYCDEIAYQIVYEDLIRDADRLQREVSGVLGLSIVDPWSAYPSFVPDEAFGYISDPRYRARALGEAA